MLNYIRQRVLNRELCLGVSANIGSPITVEMIGNAGFDWIWVDCEHGSGDYSELVHQMQAARAGGAAPVVRIAWNELPRFKRVLDLGASGVIVPYVNTAEEAQAAAWAMRFPPEGGRGVARFTRAGSFGQRFVEYYREANQNLLTVVQIETREAVQNVDEIAAVTGVDALMVGPLDLSNNLGIIDQYDHPDFIAALEQVSAACKQHGKAAGILLPSLDYLAPMVNRGFTFLSVGSDGGFLAGGLKNAMSVCRKFAENHKP